MVASKKIKNIVVIQPTLALLDETRKKLKKYQQDYKIIVRTSQEPSEEKGNLFLLTAERVMEYKDLPKIDFFVIDEFYKLSERRDDERSDILNNAFYKLLQQKPVPQFYLLGPNIDKISNGFTEKYDAEFYKTNYSLIENKTEDVYSKYEDKFSKPVKYKEFKEEKLFELLFNLQDEQTIIYCSSKDKTRDLAQKFCLYLEKQEVQKNEDLPLIEWIKEELDPNWNLIDFLSFGIGINDGALQKHINSSMVDYFNDKRLKYIFCTSTIIEGVNTSAKNIVFFDKTKGKNIKIDYFDYSNIKGRSGRMMIHYIGRIFDFNKQPEKTEEEIDIPFFEQKLPVKKEVINGMKDEDLKQETKDSKEFKELIEIPQEERILFQKNGTLIDGQKKILEQLKIDIFDEKKKELILWVSTEYYSPNYEQLTYILSLAWGNLLKDKETTFPMTIGNLIRVTSFYSNKDSGGMKWLVKDILDNNKKNRDWINENKEKIDSILSNIKDKKLKKDYKDNDEDYKKYKYSKTLFGLDDNKLLQISINESLWIIRHWFQYKVPKWLSVMNELQKYVCEKNGIEAGNYSYYASQIENDFIRDNLSILAEYGVPTSAINKLSSNIDRNLSEDEVIKKVQAEYQNNTSLLKYEKDAISRAI